MLESVSKGVLPLKYAYVGPAAFTHDALARTPQYRQSTGAALCEAYALIAALRDPARIPSQWCDVGPGNGEHTRSVLAALRGARCRIDYFLGLDISAELAEMAQQELEPELSCSWALWDFEEGPTSAIQSWRRDEPLILTLSGITLCNVEDPVATLRHLRESMNDGDILVVTLATHRPETSPERVLDYYRTPQLRDAVFEPLGFAGISRDIGELHLEFDVEESAVVGHFVISSPVVRRSDEIDVSLRPGDSIRCFLSRRYRPDQIHRLWVQSDLHVVTQALSVDGNQAVFVLTS